MIVNRFLFVFKRKHVFKREHVSRGQRQRERERKSFFKNIFKCLFIFWEHERETECEQGRGRERWRHKIQSRLQALSCQHRAPHGARTHEPWHHDPSRSQTLNWLSWQALLKVFILDVINIYNQRILSRADNLPQGGWVSSSQSKALGAKAEVSEERILSQIYNTETQPATLWILDSGLQHNSYLNFHCKDLWIDKCVISLHFILT